MSHETFYRKYRSKSFEEIVGQDHIIETLRNAISFDRLGHAYIFSGPRGTGKTSTARLLAKVLNCRENPGKTPCLRCDHCEGIGKGLSVDVIEIDAASHTGVDHIRVLNDQVTFAPVSCPYKIYIIDEAHMLSIGAFNALLKTIEEPPGNTIFILATTESHKIPVTIHSRCQHLHFKTLSSNDMMGQLRFISDKEGISISEKSLSIIAKNASGCMRDAISLLDQIFSFKGAEIQDSDVIFILGSAQFDLLCDLMGMVFARDRRALISNLDTLARGGVHWSQFCADVTQLLRQILYEKLGLGEQLDLDDARRKRISDLAQPVALTAVQSLLDVFARMELSLRTVSSPEVWVQTRLLAWMAEQASPEVQPVSAPKPAEVSEAPAASVKKDVTPRKQVASQPDKDLVATSQKAAPTSESDDPAASVQTQWTVFLEGVKQEKPGLYGLLKQARVNAVTDTTIYISLKQDFQFFREKLEEAGSKAVFNTVGQRAFGQKMSVLVGEGPPANKGPAIQDAEKINQIVAMFEGNVLS